MLEIDASAGGQVLRTAIGLSVLLGKEVEILNIRKNRPKPGLFAQHLTAIKSAALLCDAQIKGDFIGSQKVSFAPKEFKGTSLNINIGTAGSISLLLQSLVLPCFLEESNLRVIGGTDVPFAPSVNYFNEVFRSALFVFNAKFGVRLLNYGFFPKGGGTALFKSHKLKKLMPIRIDSRGQLVEVKIFSHSSMLPASVAKAQAVMAKRELEHLGVEFAEKIEPTQNPDSIGSAIDIIACFDSGICFGANALGEKGKRAEIVGKEAAQNLLAQLNSSSAAVDLHLADQLLPFMALAKGKSKIVCAKETDHIKSSIEVLEKMLEAKFEKEQKENCVEISVEGKGFF